MAKLADLFVKLGLKSTDFNSGIDKAQKKTNAFGGGLKKIGGLVAGAFAVTSIISFGKELVDLSGVAEGVRTAFERIAPAGTMEDLRKATSGTVSEIELMKRTVMASNFNIPVENLADLFAFATKRAQETGESVDYLVNSIVLGIGRKSPLILDNLGISAVDLRKKLEGVGHAGSTVGDVARAVGEIAKEAMEKSGDIIDTNAIKVASLTAKWEDFKLSVAESPAFNEAISKNLDELQDIMEVSFSSTLSGYEKFIAFTSLGAKNMRVLAEKSRKASEAQALLNKQNQEYADFMQRGIDGIIKTDEVQEKHIKTIQELIDETKTLKDYIALYNVEQTSEIQSTLRQIDANEKLIKTLTTLNQTKVLAPEKMTSKGATIDAPVFIPEDGLANMASFFDRMSEQLEDFTEDYLSDWKQLGESLDMLIVDGIVGIADEFGQAIESIFAGDFNIKELGGRMLSQIGSFLGDFGKMLIAYGIAQEAFWTSLGLGPVGAGLAIAAGVALVAIGGAISGIGSSVSKGNLSTGSISGISSVGGFSPQASTREGDNRVIFELEGTKLIGVLANTNRRIGITG